MTEQLLLHSRLPARGEELKHLRAQVRDALTGIGCSESFIHSVVLAIDEAACNVIRHAYCDMSGDLQLEIVRRGDDLVCRLLDFAPPVDPHQVRCRDLADIKPGGLGVFIINEVMDRVEFRPPPPGSGNLLEMTKRLEAE